MSKWIGLLLIIFLVLSVTAETGLSVTTEPLGATIIVNGMNVGTSPFSRSGIPAGEYTFLLQREGYLDTTFTYTVQEGKGTLDNRLSVTLTPNFPSPNTPQSTSNSPKYDANFNLISEGESSTSINSISSTPKYDANFNEIDDNSTKGTITVIDDKAKGIEYYKKDESDTLRKSWLSTGGWISADSWGGQYIYAGSDMFTLHGVGLDYTYFNRYLSPPSANQTLSSWFASTVGVGSNGNIMFGDLDMPSIGDEEMGGSMFMLNYALNFPLGGTLGSGTFGVGNSWKGGMFSLYWVPAIKYEMQVQTMDMGSMGGESTTTTHRAAINLGGFSGSIEFGGFEEKMNKTVKEAHFALYGFIIPPVSDDAPLFFLLGFSKLIYLPNKDSKSSQLASSQW